MALFNWSPMYSVGHPKMDDDHQKLFSIINSVHDDIASKKGKVALNNRLNELLDYTRYHFSAEEALMRASNYPDFDNQKRQHEIFINQILQYQKELNAANELVISTNITNSLINWLTNHVVQMDKSYKGKL